MSKRICTSAVLLVTVLSIAPVAAAAPTDRGMDEGGLAELVQVVWEDLIRFLGFRPESEPVAPDGSEGPRSLSGNEEGGPTIDP
jgi:hypothetical protein